MDRRYTVCDPPSARLNPQPLLHFWHMHHGTHSTAATRTKIVPQLLRIYFTTGKSRQEYTPLPAPPTALSHSAKERTRYVHIPHHMVVTSTIILMHGL